MRRRLHNAILRIITILAAVICALGIMTLDSDSLIPFAMTMGGMAWLTLFYYAQERR